MESGKTDVVHSCPLHRSHKSHGRTGPTSPTGPASLVRVPHIPQAPQAPQVVAQAPTSLHVPPRAQLAPQVPMAHGPTCHTNPTSLTSRTAFPKDSNGPGRGERLAGWSLRSGRAPAASASGWIPLNGRADPGGPRWIPLKDLRQIQRGPPGRPAGRPGGPGRADHVGFGASL